MSSAAHSRPKENSASRAWLRALEMTAKIDAAPERIFPDVIAELGARFGAAPALFSTRENFTHAMLAARANRYARWALAQGIAKGDRVALLMPNRAEYLAIWLGITKIGGVVALINTHLAGAALAHCLTVANPKHLIADARLDAALDGLETHAVVWRHGANFAGMVETFSGAPLEDDAATRCDPERSGPADLHLRHHRPAQSRLCQPSPGDDVDPLVRRHDGSRTQRPAL